VSENLTLRRPLPPDVASWLGSAVATEALLSALRAGPVPAAEQPPIQVAALNHRAGRRWLWHRPPAEARPTGPRRHRLGRRAVGRRAGVASAA